MSSSGKPAAVVRVQEPESNLRDMLRFVPAAIASVIFHGVLVLLIWLFPWGSKPEKELASTGDTVASPSKFEETAKMDPFRTEDVNALSTDFTTDIRYKTERKADVSVPGISIPTAPIGILDGDKLAPATSLPPPPGLGKIGSGGTALTGAVGTSLGTGTIGGYGPRGVPLAGSFYGRSGATKEYALTSGGGTKETEAAVTAGLGWILRNQFNDGSWRFDSPKYKTPSKRINNVAGTAFGLLPLLGAGKTHKTPDQEKDELEKAYSQAVHKGLMFLIRNQDKKTGEFAGDMYGHGIATICICEAFGMTQDPNLRKFAQMAVNYILYCQHEAGGWRYSPKQPGDTSVVGWQVQALKSAQMAGLNVPPLALKKAMLFLESVCDQTNEGYGYAATGSTPSMSAVGLLCRQYVESWGSKNPRLQRGVEYLLRTPPSAGNMYYTYYATQVMHHFGGQQWEEWNKKMQKSLLEAQDRSKGEAHGSWTAADSHAICGQLMQTSLCICTIEVYYRHLPLYYRVVAE